MTGPVLFAWLFWQASAMAVGVKVPGSAPEDLERQLARLDSGDPAKRRLAARSLRSIVRAEVRRSARPTVDDLVVVEARMLLQDLDARLAPRCVSMLSEPEMTRPCAQILMRLESTQSLPALKQARAAATRRGTQRSLDRAIRTLESYRREEER